MSVVRRLVLSLAIMTLIQFLAVTAFTDPVVVSGGPDNDYESSIIRLSDGRLMIVFCRNPDWVSGDLYVTFSSDDGETWDEPTAINTTSGDQATLSFVQTPGDTIRLWYASNEDGGYKIYSAWSLDGLGWQWQGPVDLGWNDGRSYYDPTVFRESDGSLTMSYVIMNNGVYVAHCPQGGLWDTLRTRVWPSGYRARIMKHSVGTYLCAYHTRTGGQYDYDVFVQTSEDLLSWSDPVQITFNFNSHDPYVCQMPDGAYMVYYAKWQGSAYNLCRRKSYDAITWDDEEQITFDATHNSTQPHLFVESDQIYMVWAYAVNFPFDHDVYFEKFDYETGIDGNGDLAINYMINIDNYPNPFNGSTTIAFVLDKSRNVKIDIFDVLGRRVSALLDRYLPAGEHQVTWIAGSQASGLYFVRLQALNQNAYLKLLLLK